MRLILIVLLTSCVFLTACSVAKPTPEQTKAALDRFIKQENPTASVSVSGVEQTQPNNFLVKFGFTNFSFKNKQGEKKSISSGKGSADFQYSNGKWTMESVTIGEQPPYENFSPNMPVID